MQNEAFFEKQSVLTYQKTKIYEEYIIEYLPRLLMTYGSCLIADLFCGPGKNGDHNGSPLILLNRLNYILKNPKFNSKENLKVHVLFNDEDLGNIENLKKEISAFSFNRDIIKIHIRNQKYEDLLPDLVRRPEKSSIPKFFFLDPFTYSNVKMVDLQNLMLLSHSEVLLFLPVFFTYRFTSAKFKKEHKTRIFIEEFTQKGMADYNDIHEFMTDIKSRLLTEIKINRMNPVPYVRYVLLDGGGSKNSLFLITGHPSGMLCMNKVAFKNTDDGKCFKVKESSQTSLFSNHENTRFHSLFRKKLIKYLESEEVVTNSAAIDFTIREGFRPMHLKEVIKELYVLKKVRIFVENNKTVSDSRKWGISESPKKETIIKWTQDEKNKN
ncbi:three-Cys-motif partner protein TcmP [Marinifilum flexuosum]|nr:three-Cys-motif partner protein TcmP [Marinifilum flexuosum]